MNLSANRNGQTNGAQTFCSFKGQAHSSKKEALSDIIYSSDRSSLCFNAPQLISGRQLFEFSLRPTTQYY